MRKNKGISLPLSIYEAVDRGEPGSKGGGNGEKRGQEISEGKVEEGGTWEMATPLSTPAYIIFNLWLFNKVYIELLGWSKSVISQYCGLKLYNYIFILIKFDNFFMWISHRKLAHVTSFLTVIMLWPIREPTASFCKPSVIIVISMFITVMCRLITTNLCVKELNSCLYLWNVYSPRCFIHLHELWHWW